MEAKGSYEEQWSRWQQEGKKIQRHRKGIIVPIAADSIAAQNMSSLLRPSL
jgi:hypothetical protein